MLHNFLNNILICLFIFNNLYLTQAKIRTKILSSDNDENNTFMLLAEQYKKEHRKKRIKKIIRYFFIILFLLAVFLGIFIIILYNYFPEKYEYFQNYIFKNTKQSNNKFSYLVYDHNNKIDIKLFQENNNNKDIPIKQKKGIINQRIEIATNLNSLIKNDNDNENDNDNGNGD